MTLSLAPTLKKFIPGILLSVLIATAATFVSEHQGGPALLYALLFGMTLKTLAENAAAGIAFSSRTILRIGVALLGFRISIEQITALGLGAAMLVATGLVATILFGRFLAIRMGYKPSFGILTGGATAICGASAALAISSLLPPDEISERDTTFAVVAVTTLSTLCMILYPPAMSAIGISNNTAGFMIGATVHDVAQVVGAGYMISPEAGDLATVTKLFRVALLVPITAVLAVIFTKKSAGGKRKTAMAPWFLVLFVGFVALRSAGLVTDSLVSLTNDASRWCLCVAIGAVGLKTSLGDFKSIGPKAVLLALAETIFLIAFIAGGYYLLS